MIVGSRGELRLPPRHVWTSCKAALRTLGGAILAAIVLAGPAFGSPPGAVIANQASLDYFNAAGQSNTVLSNEVTVVTAVLRSPSSIEFTRVTGNGAGVYRETVGPAACLQGPDFVTLGNPTSLGGTAVDPGVAQDLAVTSAYNSGEFGFIRLADSDQNLDYQQIEYAVVTVSSLATGDSETVRLTETGMNTGVFAGYLRLATGAGATGDCMLQGATNTGVIARYSDPVDSGDTTEARAQLDPMQRVFESRTGTLISGSTVEIVDAASGLPAVVYGNDGFSQFPSAIVSGGTATDSSGTAYAFGPGEYRFPVVPDGDYRLVVTPPPAFLAPSSVTIDELQALPGAPYRLSPASFGRSFRKNDGVSIAVDIPLDPLSSELFLQKRTLTAVAAPGDFVRYEIALENVSSTGVAREIRIVDQLPRGLRFVKGSASIGDESTDDPILNAELGTLEFFVDTLPLSGRLSISYVAEVVSGQPNDELVNTATAFAAGGVTSNESSAVIRLTEDLFRSTATLIGRVVEADCGQSTFSDEQGVADVRVYLEDGRYAVTDDGGRYHFEGLSPGSHVAQLDIVTVPDYFDVIGCDEAPGFAGSADSQFVRLSPGSLRRADFYVRRKPRPKGRIDIEMRNSGTDSAEQVAYELILNGVGNVEIDNIGVTVVLPEGVEYLPGTLTVNGGAYGEPRLVGPTVSMALDGQFGNWTSRVSFVAEIDAAVVGELATKALAKFDTPMEAKQTTPLVETKMYREPAVLENDGYVLDLKFAVLSDELSPQDMRKLDLLIEDWRGAREIQLSAVGHTDSQRIKASNRHIFADNYALAHARALSTANYIADALGIPARNIQVEGRGPDDPVADNAGAAGRQKNRRVELIMSGIRPKKPSFLEVTQESSGTRETPTVGAVPGTGKSRKRESDEDSQLGMPSSQHEPPIDSLRPGYAMLLPARAYAPAIASTKVSIQHEPGQVVDLTLNGVAVGQLNFDGTVTNAAGTVAVSRWIGVDLVDGANELRAVIRDPDGNKAKGIRRTIHFTGSPIRAEFVEELSTLIADGKERPVIALRLYDRSGKPARSGVVGRFRVDSPYRSAWDEENDRKNALVEIGERSASYRVGADGIVRLELAPTTQTGQVTVVLPFENYREQEIRAWLKPAQRDWILVGFAEGTAGYATLSDNTAAAIDAGNEEGFYDDGRVAFFAKGSVKGEYLLTLAYDSARDRRRDRFETIVDPNAYYALYADVSEQRFDAASQRKLYVKLERSQFYALFGDFDTGLSVTDLGRYERRFNGVKTEYRGRNVGYTAFAAETDQSFNRDEIRGDGTSGLYRLGAAPIIANSELVRIEVRDRFDTGIVLSAQRLTRFLDYNLDTLDGTLYFKKPVPSRDADLNPVYIIVEYESLSAGTEDLVAGGRAALRLADDAIEVGVTHIDDSTRGAEAELSGIDLRWQINDETLVKAEIADSTAVRAGAEQSGSAQALELEHNGENVDIRAFISEVDDGFGLGYQSQAGQGVRRLGLDTRAKLGERFSVEGEAGWQQNLQTESIRNVARGLVRYERDDFTARVGLAHAEDKFEDGERISSDLAEIGITQKILDGKVKFRLSGSSAIDKDAGNLDYPEQYIVGADYRFADGVDVVAEYEDANGRELDATMMRLGVRATPWSRAQINSFVTSERTEFGPRLFANVGLIQGFQVSERWIVDIGFDQSNTLVDSNARQFDADRELASGSLNEDFFAAYAGAMYTSELWSANARVEIRESDTEDRVSLLAGWYREPGRGHGLSAGLTIFQGENMQQNELQQANMKFGWAYRPAERPWSFLNRTDLIYDRASSMLDAQESWRIINNFNANLRISAASQLSLQYAFKYLRSEFDGEGYTGYTDLVGIDYRRGINDRWDAGVNTSIYHSYRSKVMDYAAGIDVGYNVGRNLWLSLGYNIFGFDDRDLERARYTAAGPYLRFSLKADQHLLRAIAGQR